MKKLLITILALTLLTACTAQTATVEETSATSETMISSESDKIEQTSSNKIMDANKSTTPKNTNTLETTTEGTKLSAEEIIDYTDDKSIYTEEIKQSYLLAKQKAEKDNDKTNVTYCAEISDFLAEKQTDASELLKSGIYMNYRGMDYYDYNDNFSENRYGRNMYPYNLTFSQSLDDDIFCGLNIGTDYSQIEKELGNPNNVVSDYYSEKSGAIYYFDGYSAMFYGEKDGQIEYIGIIKMPELDESYKNLLQDIIGWCNANEDVYSKLRINYPDAVVNDDALRMYVRYSNGIAVSSYYDINISPSYYGAFDYVDINSNSVWISWSTEDEDLSSFVSFCATQSTDN